jgi:hypothetical protein
MDDGETSLTIECPWGDYMNESGEEPDSSRNPVPEGMGPYRKGGEYSNPPFFWRLFNPRGSCTTVVGPKWRS